MSLIPRRCIFLPCEVLILKKKSKSLIFSKFCRSANEKSQYVSKPRCFLCRGSDQPGPATSRRGPGVFQSGKGNQVVRRGYCMVLGPGASANCAPASRTPPASGHGIKRSPGNQPTGNAVSLGEKVIAGIVDCLQSGGNGISGVQHAVAQIFAYQAVAFIHQEQPDVGYAFHHFFHCFIVNHFILRAEINIDR